MATRVFCRRAEQVPRYCEGFAGLIVIFFASKNPHSLEDRVRNVNMLIGLGVLLLHEALQTFDQIFGL